AHYVLLLSLFVSSRAAPLSLHSFPPRRSSDLPFHRQGEPLYRIFKRLFTILPSHDTGHFTYFFHKHGRIRELVKITYTGSVNPRSEEHTSELQSRENLVCRLLLEKKKKQKKAT